MAGAYYRRSRPHDSQGPGERLPGAFLLWIQLSKNYIPSSRDGVPREERSIPWTERRVLSRERHPRTLRRRIPLSSRGAIDGKYLIPSRKRLVYHREHRIPCSFGLCEYLLNSIPHGERIVPSTERSIPSGERHERSRESRCINPSQGIPQPPPRHNPLFQDLTDPFAFGDPDAHSIDARPPPAQGRGRSVAGRRSVL